MNVHFFNERKFENVLQGKKERERNLIKYFSERHKPY